MLIAPSQLHAFIAEQKHQLACETEEKREHGIPLTEDEEAALFEVSLLEAAAEAL